jgi:antitoxin component of MazEF toxin-antitoxin module
MIEFGNRKISKQGGSYMIALPMTWVRSIGTDVKTVDVSLGKDHSLKIKAVTDTLEKED